jgi:hypothetical protein
VLRRDERLELAGIREEPVRPRLGVEREEGVVGAGRLSAAWMEAMPGLQIGVGGRPV